MIETICNSFPRGPFRAAIFDFDGTLSLLRRNWQDVMIPMMVEILSAVDAAASREDLFSHVEEFVMRLNGRQTIYQMIQLADEVKQRGGQPLDPLEYKNQYHDLLWQQVSARIDAAGNDRAAREQMMVPMAEAMLSSLQKQGLTLFLASGTDLKYVQNELEVLGLQDYFGPRVYGALDDYKNFSKAMIIEKIIHDCKLQGNQLIGFGDGFVEIEEIKKVRGLAVGVASNEKSREGINDWKRQRLIRAGADLIIGDYTCRQPLLEMIGSK